MRVEIDTRNLKQRIQDRYRENHSLDFHLHNELLALSCLPEDLASDGDSETCGFEELLFAVEKDWLIAHLNRTTCAYWNADNVKKWLKTEHTSEDAAAIFKAAILQKAVIMIEFN